MPAVPLEGQSQPGQRHRLALSGFVGAGSFALTGGPSQGGRGDLGPLGVSIEHPVGRSLSLRAELFGQAAGTELESGVGGLFEAAELSRGQAGVAALIRRYSSPAEQAFFVSLGASVTAQTYCDVDLATGVGFFGGETVECEDWDQDFRPSSPTASVIVAAGITRGRLDFEVRYDQGVQTAIETQEGDMRVSVLAAVVHYRFKRWR